MSSSVYWIADVPGVTICRQLLCAKGHSSGHGTGNRASSGRYLAGSKLTGLWAGPEEGPARVAHLLRANPAAGKAFCAFLVGRLPAAAATSGRQSGPSSADFLPLHRLRPASLTPVAPIVRRLQLSPSSSRQKEVQSTSPRFIVL